MQTAPRQMMRRFIGMGPRAVELLNLGAAGTATLEKKPLASSRRASLTCSILGVLIALAGQSFAAINLSSAETRRIGNRIWQNECGGTVAGLTAWNTGENFASLGIGHFIWYPQGVHGPFEESFPKFLAFAREQHTAIPAWLNQSLPCPWNSRAEFSSAQNSAQMRELRQFLSRTIDVQAQFMVARLQQSLAKMLDEAPAGERANIEQQFARVAGTPHGCYALVDYVNFKGEGVLHTERYRGEGWGLLQALEKMHDTQTGAGAAREFSNSAAAILRRRVQNSPPERHEAR